ncbi:MAG TPA: phosphotransferase [Gaiellaceae bacterium]|nr:phosphotransferase [Gaiellaceae bacterium]
MSTGTGSESAVAAAVAVARAHGVRCEEPVVLRDAWHVLVHLAPSPIVARVSSAIPFPDGPKPDDVVRELHVARHAALAGAPVIPPTEDPDPGPHRHGAHFVTFWRYVPPAGDVDPGAAGRGLRSIHEALTNYEGPILPPMGHGDDVDAMLAAVEDSADVELLRTLAARRPMLDGQALHGDAHLGNVLRAREGQYWHDLESTCHGPREYDLAALIMHDRTEGDAAAREALAAYGPHDADLLEALVPVYAAWIYASFLLAVPRRPELAPILEDRLRWLRRYA